MPIENLYVVSFYIVYLLAVLMLCGFIHVIPEATPVLTPMTRLILSKYPRMRR